MAYIDRGELFDQLVDFERELLRAGDEDGAHIVCHCRGIAANQKIITAVWNDDVCSQCGRKTKDAMTKHYEWCPVCGAEMTNEWEDEEEEDEEEDT